MQIKLWIQQQKLKLQTLKRRQLVIGGMVGALLIVWGISVLLFSEKYIGTDKAAAEVQQLAENIRRFYQNRPDFWGLNTQAVLDKQIAPRAISKSGRLMNFFGKEVVVGSGIEGMMLMPGSRNFDIVYKNLNKQECVETASFRFEEKFWLGVESVTVTNADHTAVFSWDDKENLLPAKTEKVKKICQNEGNAVLWHFQ